MWAAGYEGVRTTPSPLPRLGAHHRHHTDHRRRRHPAGWLIDQARKHRVLQSSRFVGHLDHTELLALLHRADAAVLPATTSRLGWWHRRPPRPAPAGDEHRRSG